MEISAAEYADRAGISPRRVRQLAEKGDIKARRLGGRWVVDESSLVRHSLPIRPLSRGNAWALAAWIDGNHDVPAYQRARFRDLAKRLSVHPEPELLLAAWLSARASTRSYRADPTDISDLQRDPRLALSGVSHPISGLLRGAEVDAYVTEQSADAVEKDWLLTDPAPGAVANVVLRRVHEIPDPVPLSIVAADLADHLGWRERAAARAIIQGVR